MAHEYLIASSVSEALALLATRRGEAQLIAGGTHLGPLVERGECSAQTLVDISRIASMRRVLVQADELLVGGAVTSGELQNDSFVRRFAPLLAQAADAMARSERLSRSTLAGALATSIQSEVATALVTSNAEIQITNMTGSQWLPVTWLFVRPGVTRVDSSSEIITAIRCPLMVEGEGAALVYQQAEEPEAPLLLVLALWLSIQAENAVVSKATLACGGEEQVPTLLPHVAEPLLGQPGGERHAIHEFSRILADTLLDTLPPQMATQLGRAAVIRLGQQALGQALTMAHASQSSAEGPER